jgi:hypothetical protein
MKKVDPVQHLISAFASSLYPNVYHGSDHKNVQLNSSRS